MNNQNLILIGVGIFLSLIITVAAVDQYMMSKHDPMRPDGLIWRVQTAFDRVKDLEAVIAVEREGSSTPVRFLLRFIDGTNAALSVRYLDPASLRDELFTVNRDLLSHYIPQENVIVVKRWSGFPLAQIGLVGFSLRQLATDYAAGRVHLKVVRDEAGFSMDLFPSPLVLTQTISGQRVYPPVSPFFPLTGVEVSPDTMSISRVSPLGMGGAIRGDFILEVSDSRGTLTRMIWIDPDTYLVKRMVVFSAGRRTTTVNVERILLNQGLTADEILALPRGVEVIHG